MPASLTATDVRALLRPVQQGDSPLPAWVAKEIERDVRPLNDDALDAMRIWSLAHMAADRVHAGVCVSRDRLGRAVVEGRCCTQASTARQQASRLRSRLARQGVVGVAMLVQACEAPAPSGQPATSWMMVVEQRLRGGPAGTSRNYRLAGTPADDWDLLGPGDF